MIRTLIASLCLLSAVIVRAQAPNTNLVAYYSFDAGTAVESQGSTSSDGLVTGNPLAACGAVGGSLRFDGVRDYVTITGNAVNDLFELSDFVVSFYFHPTGVNARQTLLRKKVDCAVLDRQFSIDYLPARNSIEINFSENPSRFVGGPTNLIPLNPMRCWHHLAVERRGTEIRVYLNGDRVSRFNGPTRFNITNPGNLEIARAGCPSTESNFAGFIDELRIYRGTLTVDEVESLYTPVDLIGPLAFPVINIGTEVQLSVPNTCANSFTWTPKSSIIAGEDTPSPTVAPTQSTTYYVKLAFPMSGCRATDSVLVQVFDPESYDCSQLLVPAAFSPNGLGPESNEALGISNAATLQSFDVYEIYDRWGNKVFATTDRFGRWDGTYNGEQAMPGVYMWRVAYGCSDQDLSKTGSVVLMR